MKKILTLLTSIFLILTSSLSVVSCSQPQGESIDVHWNETSSIPSTPDGSDPKLDPFIASEVLFPIFNMVNSTKESRSEAKKVNDGMTDDQINNSLESKEQTFLTGTESSLWQSFFNSWSSSSDYYYKEIEISSTSELKTVQEYNSSEEDDGYLITTSNIANTIDYLNKNFYKEDDYTNRPFAYVNLSNDISDISDTFYDAKNLSLKMSFEGADHFTYNINLTHLVGEVTMIKTPKDGYKWSFQGYNFVSKDYYPMNNYDSSGNYFSFLPGPISDSNNKYNFINLKYSIDPETIETT